ncbi:hypothetical protein K435DRAFT_963931 [Dendrothele bispora CBS 962.96]|uniref:Uncharacterized protein n=1 Tax=Dendrothele bispora (strain CBS 962.96) TaxID=1314807 RepID=A0A4V4HGY5_DENBC|nr:hypothetical protein K435DRAFT_963931 [Dendrothele bispora CBS 962.96]
MFKFLTLTALVALIANADAAITTGHYQIKDFQGRCIDFTPTSNNAFVPVVTAPCDASKQTQIWNVVADSPFTTTYIIITTSGASSVISYSASTANGAAVSGLHQQLQLNTSPPPEEDLFINQVDSTHWTLSNTRGGFRWTSWAARSSDPTLASPVTLDDSSTNSAGPQQLFTFVGPL